VCVVGKSAGVSGRCDGGLHLRGVSCRIETPRQRKPPVAQVQVCIESLPSATVGDPCNF
jgi:hypothetical protein